MLAVTSKRQSLAQHMSSSALWLYSTPEAPRPSDWSTLVSHKSTKKIKLEQIKAEKTVKV